MEFRIFSARLKQLRQENGLTQRKMSEILRVTTNHYQRIEYGTVNIPVSTLCVLADYFGVTTDYLLGRELSEGRESDKG